MAGEEESTSSTAPIPFPTLTILYLPSEAMPVVEDGSVLGVVSSDLLAQRYLPQLWRSQSIE